MILHGIIRQLLCCTISHYQDLSYCGGLVHGASCGLSCRATYVKSGDPTCVDGQWTEDRCYAHWTMISSTIISEKDH